MDYNKIVMATIEVFRKCDVHSFPIDCGDLLRHYGYRVITYKELLEKIRSYIPFVWNTLRTLSRQAHRRS